MRTLLLLLLAFPFSQANAQLKAIPPYLSTPQCTVNNICMGDFVIDTTFYKANINIGDNQQAEVGVLSKVVSIASATKVLVQPMNNFQYYGLVTRHENQLARMDRCVEEFCPGDMVWAGGSKEFIAEVAAIEPSGSIILSITQLDPTTGIILRQFSPGWDSSNLTPASQATLN